MIKWTVLFVLILAMGLGSPIMAASDHQGHGGAEMTESNSMQDTSEPGAFAHRAVAQGVVAEFQVMSLASMKMTDPGGATHHVMVSLSHEGMNHPIQDASGKIKVISPSGKEQVESLKNYGETYAANFTFTEKGDYGVVCLFRLDGQDRVVKFWYPHD